MYREDGWMAGHYIDNHKKYECIDCGKQFIVGEKSIEDCLQGFPLCPYCGQSNVECISWTDDEMLQELSSDLGCLAIYLDTDIENRNLVKENAVEPRFHEIYRIPRR